MVMLAGVYTDVGLKKKNNQDAFGLRLVRHGAADAGIVLVCDGVGGLAEGEIASGVTVRAFLDWFDAHVEELLAKGVDQNEIIAQWGELSRQVNECIFHYGRERQLSVGTTAVVLLVVSGRVMVMNIGDSRLYQGCAGELRQVTKDHTLVQREVDQGVITQEQALTDPRQHVLIRCLGAEEKAVPDFYAGVIDGDSFYLLCSDGFRNTLTEAEMLSIRDNRGSSWTITEHLRKLTELAKSREERDNITSAVLSVREDSEDTEATVTLETGMIVLSAKERTEPRAAELWKNYAYPENK